MDIQMATIIVSSIISAAVILTVAIIKFDPKLKNIKWEAKDIPLNCPEHSGLKASLDEHRRDIAEIKEDLKNIKSYQDTSLIKLGRIEMIVESMNNRRRDD